MAKTISASKGSAPRARAPLAFDAPASVTARPAVWCQGKLQLTMALSAYDQTRDLVSGAVRADGIELTALDFPVEEIFFRFSKYREFDVSEMSFAKYVARRALGDDAFIAIPVFPSRVFRHSSIYVRRKGPVKAPADLKGRRVGVPEWAQTAAVYSRGLLMHEYGLKLRDIHWVQAGVNDPGRVEKVALKLPPGVEIERVADKSLNEMLLEGAIDAALTAHPPAAIEAGDGRIGRLFANYAELEADYYKRTGIWPIMHTIVLRREIMEEAPWAAMNLLKAFDEARRRSLKRVGDVTASRVPLPWGADLVAKARALFGPELWPYGVEANKRTLDAFLDYAFEQGVTQRRLALAEMFAPQTYDRFKI
ncbi:MAG TPA: 4,5-dihydroxyphthalate decarboxylase [Alphaproteobacteria bacterium]|nr:4,5-dihydroxyphthalate decarboxylase [Alphaproteobacteria bacterium]